jgi:hypothetical protein
MRAVHQHRALGEQLAAVDDRSQFEGWGSSFCLRKGKILPAHLALIASDRDDQVSSDSALDARGRA